MSENDINQNTQMNTAAPNNAPVMTQATAPVMTTDQALLKLISTGRKQLFYQRILALAAVGIFAVILYTVITIVPKITSTLDNVDQVISDATASIEQIDGMVAEMTDASRNLNKLVDENAEPLTTAVQNLSDVDFEGLNKAITDLQDAVGPVANFFNKFR